MTWRELLHIDLTGWMGKGPKQGKISRRKRCLRVTRRNRELLRVSRQLTALVEANVDLSSALASLALPPAGWSTQRVLKRLSLDLSAGMTLSQAMRHQPLFFPRYYADRVEAAENTGSLGTALSRLCEHIETSSVSETVTGWITYITWLALPFIALVTFILVRVFPALSTAFFMDCEIPKPWLIKHIELAGDWFSNSMHVNMLLAGGVLCLVLFIRWLYLPPFREVAEIRGFLAARIPVLRSLTRQLNTGHASRILACLLEGGVPLDQALASAAASDLNPRFARAFSKLAQRVAGGESLTKAIAEGPRGMFPESFGAFVSMGEASGMLPEVFEQAAALYGRQSLSTERVLARSLMPCVLAIPASCVLLLAYAFFSSYSVIVNALADSI